MTMPDHVERLKALLIPGVDGRRTLMSVPGCWDGVTALMVERAGFDCAFLSGAALAMARLGRPDVGLVTASELVDTVALIRDCIAIPLIVDADAGFGNALNCQRTVHALERAGASAVQIEDQQFPKRCGHLSGNTVVPLDEAVGRIRAAVDVRDHALIIARTDAVAVEGMGSALDRASAYAEAGADLLFIEGPFTVEEVARIGRQFGHHPLVHNLSQDASSPVAEGVVLEQLGFAIALHPLLLLNGLVQLGDRLLTQLRTERSAVSMAGQIGTLTELDQMLGTQALIGHADGYLQ